MAAAASSSSSCSWIYHFTKPEMCRFSLSALYPNGSTRFKARQRLLLVPKCSSSLNEEESRVVEESKNTTEKKDYDLSLVNIPRPRGRRRRRRRNPVILWKRIFFASKKVRSIMLLNILTVIYASDIPVLKEVEQIMDPAFFSVVRFVVTAMPFLPFIIQERKDHKIRSAGIELGIWVSLGYLSQALGLLTSDAGQASFISAFTIIVVPLIDGIFGATVPALTWTGALLSLIGIGIMECGGSSPCVGDILNIMSAVFFGVHMFRTEQISRSTKREKFLALLGYQLSVVALSSSVWFLSRDMFGEAFQLNFESRSWEWSGWWDLVASFPWIPAIYTGVFSTGLCLWAELDAMRDVSATEAAIVYGLEPVWGAAFAWFLLGERWDFTEWFGAALVLCGSLTVQILGSSSEESSNKKGARNSNQSLCVAPKDQNGLSLSTVVVKTKKNDGDLFRKKDKL